MKFGTYDIYISNMLNLVAMLIFSCFGLEILFFGQVWFKREKLALASNMLSSGKWSYLGQI